jgi:carboxyl-terminal processing protease
VPRVVRIWFVVLLALPGFGALAVAPSPHASAAEPAAWLLLDCPGGISATGWVERSHGIERQARRYELACGANDRPFAVVAVGAVGAEADWRGEILLETPDGEHGCALEWTGVNLLRCDAGGYAAIVRLVTAPVTPVAPPLPSRAERRDLIEAIAQAVEADFLYGDADGFDWEAIRAEFEERAMAADDSEAFYGAITEMILALGDDHSFFRPPWMVNDLGLLAYGFLTYEGVGLVGEYTDDGLLVGYVFAGSPAEAAGLRLRDRITAIDGRPYSAGVLARPLHPRQAMFALDGRPFDALEDPLGLSGPVGTEVTVTVRSPGEPPRDLEIERGVVFARVAPESRRLAAAPEVGYLRIPSFLAAHDMERQVELALQHLLDDGTEPLEGLILDLRHNTGGPLSGAAGSLFGQFLRGEVATLRDRDGDERRWVVEESMHFEALRDVPVVVLVDRVNNSAGEWVPAILRAHDRALVVGTLTNGNTENTEWHLFADGSNLQLAVEQLVLPGGEIIEGSGVPLDVRIDVDWTAYPEADDPHVLAALELLDDR